MQVTIRLEMTSTGVYTEIYRVVELPFLPARGLQLKIDYDGSQRTGDSAVEPTYDPEFVTESVVTVEKTTFNMRDGSANVTWAEEYPTKAHLDAAIKHFVYYHGFATHWTTIGSNGKP